MDTEEMYHRGVADAELGELHPFYYQHYYHYRRGHDETRRRLRRSSIWNTDSFSRAWLFLAAIILIVVGVGAFVVLRSPSRSPAASRRPIAAQSNQILTSVPARTPIFPTSTPTPAPPELHVGGMALVSNTDGKPLRGRQEPGLGSPARVSFKEGDQVRIVEGPVEADGYTWWRLEGQGGVGWSAQQSQDGIVWLQPTDG